MSTAPPIAGVIIAGGKGTRLHPVTLEIPKPLLTVGRKPIVQHLVELFRAHDIRPIYVTVYHEDVPLFERWVREYDLTDVVLVPETERLGTWGGLRAFLAEQKHDTTFVVSNGDELKEFDITKLVSFHRANNAMITLGTVSVPNPSDYGVIESDTNGHVRAFHYKPEHPPTDHIMAGIYVAEPDVLSLTDTAGVLSFEEDILPKTIALGKLYECAMPGRWNDCGTFARYEEAIREWAGKEKA